MAAEAGRNPVSDGIDRPDDEIERLRAYRGGQHVPFAHVADHMRDYIERHPGDVAAVQRLASFLVAVEHLPHDHDADLFRGLPRPRLRP